MFSGKRDLKGPAAQTFTFDGDKLTRESASKKAKASTTYKVKIDTETWPHAIEPIPEGGKRGPVGTYQVEKGELFLALGRPTGVKGDKSLMVPKGFRDDAGPVHVVKREKEGK